MRESILHFESAPPRFGIRTHPDGGGAGPCVVLVNSGIVHRVGANRMSVALARHLAEHGYASLRFDLSGLGDAPDRPDGLGWEAAAPLEISAALDAVEAERGPGEFVLYGNCGGAAKSFWAAQRDPRVRGLLLTNPPPHPADGDFEAEVEAAADARAAAAAMHPGRVGEAMAALFARGVQALFVYARGDVGERYFAARLEPALAPYLAGGQLTVVSVPHCNHTFAPAASRRRVLDAAAGWLRARFGAPGPA
jgi:pimeloyl-ACP methyl ester carboxylesterase